MKFLVKLFLGAVAYIYSSMVFAVTLSDAANKIFIGASILSKFGWVTCILIGIFLLVGFLVNYQTHKRNPKLVPLSTVITYLILGVLTISIPFLNNFFGSDSYDTATKSVKMR